MEAAISAIRRIHLQYQMDNFLHLSGDNVDFDPGLINQGPGIEGIDERIVRDAIVHDFSYSRLGYGYTRDKKKSPLFFVVVKEHRYLESTRVPGRKSHADIYMEKIDPVNRTLIGLRPSLIECKRGFLEGNGDKMRNQIDEVVKDVIKLGKYLKRIDGQFLGHILVWGMMKVQGSPVVCNPKEYHDRVRKKAWKSNVWLGEPILKWLPLRWEAPQAGGSQCLFPEIKRFLWVAISEVKAQAPGVHLI